MSCPSGRFMNDGWVPFRSFGPANFFESRKSRRRRARAASEKHPASHPTLRSVQAACDENNIQIRRKVMTMLATGTGIEEHEVVSPEQWIASRKELLRKEKEFTRLRDDLSRQ